MLLSVSAFTWAPISDHTLRALTSQIVGTDPQKYPILAQFWISLPPPTHPCTHTLLPLHPYHFEAIPRYIYFIQDQR